jgi:hypothetical protein
MLPPQTSLGLFLLLTVHLSTIQSQLCDVLSSIKLTPLDSAVPFETAAMADFDLSGLHKKTAVKVFHRSNIVVELSDKNTDKSPTFSGGGICGTGTGSPDSMSKAHPDKTGNENPDKDLDENENESTDKTNVENPDKTGNETPDLSGNGSPDISGYESPDLSGNSGDCVFKFERLVFNWKSEDPSTGGKEFPLETHLLFFNQK